MVSQKKEGFFHKQMQLIEFFFSSGNDQDNFSDHFTKVSSVLAYYSESIDILDNLRGL